LNTSSDDLEQDVNGPSDNLDLETVPSASVESQEFSQAEELIQERTSLSWDLDSDSARAQEMESPPDESEEEEEEGALFRPARPQSQSHLEEPASASTLRVEAQKVDSLLNQVGELVVARSEFDQMVKLFRDLAREITSRGRLSKGEERRLRSLGFMLNESTLSLGRVANNLQDSVMRIRMLPIVSLFGRFPRVVRDQALKLGKSVELLVEGGETEIDKRVLEGMMDPLVQFIRNAIAHGIETPEERRKAGKPETGTIRLAAYHEGDLVALEIEDDGRGIDVPNLRKLLVKRRLLGAGEAERLSDREVMSAIFLPGVSTRECVDGSAGRGVGLDVVKENIERMNGTIEVESFPEVGTRFTIRIPLTVSIIRALLVKSAGQVFTLPLSAVSEILRFRNDESHTIEGFQVITLRGKTIPVLRLDRILNLPTTLPDNAPRFAVVVSTSFREVGLVVDGLLGEREVVLKAVEDGYYTFEGFSGATVLGDGTVSLVLDVNTLIRSVKSRLGEGLTLAETVLH
jgi:two-component system chemotaxis sensor kinase CheA